MIINASPHYIIFFIEELFVDYDVRNCTLVYISFQWCSTFI